jgi:RNA polymerase sigma-70 factor (ECF subfamily)
VNEIDDITLERAARGDRAAFGRLYAHYSPFVWRLCWRSSNGDRECATELVQNTFVKTYRYLRGFEKGSALSTWLYRIAYSCINEYFAKAALHNSRTAAFDEEYMGAAQPHTPYEDQQLVAELLKPLNEAERFLLTAREADGLSYEELAVITGDAAGALRTRLSRLKSEIRKRFEKMDCTAAAP